MSRILVIDDDEDIRAIINMTLTDEGYEVVEAADGYEAVTTLINDPKNVDMILLDLRMPGMDGNAVLGWLKSKPDLCQPVVVLTGYMGELKEENKDRILTIIDKPGPMKSLVHTVNSAMRRHAR